MKFFLWSYIILTVVFVICGIASFFPFDGHQVATYFIGAILASHLAWHTHNKDFE